MRWYYVVYYKNGHPICGSWQQAVSPKNAIAASKVRHRYIIPEDMYDTVKVGKSHEDN